MSQHRVVLIAVDNTETQSCNACVFNDREVYCYSECMVQNFPCSAEERDDCKSIHWEIEKEPKIED